MIKHLKTTADAGLTVVPLQLATMRFVLYTDTSFSNARSSKSQLGFVLLLLDGNDNGNVSHYGSRIFHPVTRSVLASEVHGLVQGFFVSFDIHHMLKEVLRKKLKIEAYVDSRSVFDVVSNQGKTVEKRLQIDIQALKESYVGVRCQNWSGFLGQTTQTMA